MGMHGGSMTCMAMLRSGVTSGMEIIIKVTKPIRWDVRRLMEFSFIMDV